MAECMKTEMADIQSVLYSPEIFVRHIKRAPVHVTFFFSCSMATFASFRSASALIRRASSSSCVVREFSFCFQLPYPLQREF